ncbi:hypothetical protein MUDAN_DOGOELCO_00691 [Lactiplantibacillus mudanjiangensis]|uniref:hypothetical protein n=1 Tax=Lactiplantibacillus mudanjiangensis TaxID=1296538 RepID=UPI001014D711|nr:hypothetical protein MUDAN_DOGOELCO_00691 [Lactiplantibacillus mudanjiangensis]
MKLYQAKIMPLNADAIGTAAHGQASFVQTKDQLIVTIEMFDTPANIQHWEHFHGFPDGQEASIATMAQDVNHDGFVDLPETEPVSGTTMVPFNDTPETMDVANDAYPVADVNGYFAYTKIVPLKELDTQFKQVFHDSELTLDKRVIYIHGVANSLQLPSSVAGEVATYDAHVTLPIAVGKIELVSLD